MAFPLLVQAGLFSFLSGFVEAKKETPKSTQNVQNVSLLQASLNSNPNPPQGGADITIVDESALFADNNSIGGLDENQTNRPSSDQISLYVVREGDSLSEIADMFDVSVNTIRWNNDITGSTISPGQTLVILPVSGIRHTVKSKDTLASIAKRYKGDLDEIKKYNDITEDTKLAVGDIVIIPDGEILPQPTKASAAAARTTLVSAQVTVDGGYYVRPTVGKKTQGIHGYNAVDIAPPTGTAIVAAADGKVIISRTSGWNGGYGNYVVVEHGNGTQTLYAHMSENIATQGSSVVQGQVLGYVGMTGKATGPHLHFEIRGAKNPF